MGKGNLNAERWKKILHNRGKKIAPGVNDFKSGAFRE